MKYVAITSARSAPHNPRTSMKRKRRSTLMKVIKRLLESIAVRFGLKNKSLRLERISKRKRKRKDRAFTLWCMYLKEIGEAFFNNETGIIRVFSLRKRDRYRTANIEKKLRVVEDTDAQFANETVTQVIEDNPDLLYSAVDASILSEFTVPSQKGSAPAEVYPSRKKTDSQLAGRFGAVENGHDDAQETSTASQSGSGSVHGDSVDKPGSSAQSDDSEDDLKPNKLVFEEPLFTSAPNSECGSKKNRPGLKLILSIIHLAVVTRTSLYGASDLLKWIQEGKLIYFNADQILPAEFRSCGDDHSFFTLISLPSHRDMRSSALFLCRFLGLGSAEFPPIDIFTLTQKYITELNLPGEMVTHVQNLLYISSPTIQFKPEGHVEARRYSTFPCSEAFAMSYILLILRNLFAFTHDLDQLVDRYSGALVKERGVDCTKPPFVLQTWLNAMFKRYMEDKSIHSPQHDIQAVRDLSRAVDYFETICPPEVRYKAGQQQGINRDIREKLIKVLDRSKELMQSRAHTNKRPLDEAFDKSDSNETSTQESSARANASSNGVRQEVASFRHYTLRHLVEPLNFLGDGCTRDEFLSFLTKHLPRDDAVILRSALLAPGRYAVMNSKEMEKSTTLTQLIQVLAHHIRYEPADLLQRYGEVEAAYIAATNPEGHFPLPTRHLKKHRYFPLPEARRKPGWMQTEDFT